MGDKETGEQMADTGYQMTDIRYRISNQLPETSNQETPLIRHCERSNLSRSREPHLSFRARPAFTLLPSRGIYPY